MTISKETVGVDVGMRTEEVALQMPEMEDLGSFSEISMLKTVFQTDGGMPTRTG